MRRLTLRERHDDEYRERWLAQCTEDKRVNAKMRGPCSNVLNGMKAREIALQKLDALKIRK